MTQIPTMNTNYRGIDYGLGRSNIDKATGIRYGVIAQNSLMPEVLDDFESDYGEPHCPKCGNPVKECQGEDSGKADRECYECAAHECQDYVCHDCEYVFGGESAFPDEALGIYLDDGEYKAASCLDADLMVVKSPYFTRAQFCSPCVPGAGNLDSPCPDGERCYCFGHDFFDGGKAPYPVYSVETGLEIQPQ